MSEKFESFVSPLKVAELKDELKKRGLSPYGNKASLQQRLMDALQSEGPTTDLGEQPDQSDFKLALSDSAEGQDEDSAAAGEENPEQDEENPEQDEDNPEQDKEMEESNAASEQNADKDADDVGGEEEPMEEQQQETVAADTTAEKDEKTTEDLKPSEGDAAAEVTTSQEDDNTGEKKEGAAEDQSKTEEPTSRKRPREEDAEGEKQEEKKATYEIIDEYLAEDDYVPPDDDSLIVLDRYHSDLHFAIQKDGLGGYGRTEKGFAYLWAGSRATWGCKDGRYCFECKIGEYLDVDLPPSEEHPHIVRVGFSTENSSMNLGEVAQSYGYGATGKSSTAGMFNSYGESFGPGDVIGCFVDLHSEEQNIAFSKNGKHFGKCFVLSPDFRGKVLFPHVTTKNVRVSLNFGKDPLHYEIPDDFEPLQKATSDHLVRSTKPPERKQDCEAIMMVGLPSSGKTTWAEKYAQEHPDKFFNILGTNLIMDKMKVSGLQRKRNYHGRWEQLIKQATQILNKLFILAARQPRNYIIDQTNVYKNARARKMKNFEGYKCRAVVICPTEEVRKQRDKNRQRDQGIFIPDDAVYEMKANYSLPEVDDTFDEVTFVEQTEEEIKEQVKKYHEEKRPPTVSPYVKRPRYDSPSRGGSRRGGGYDSRPPPHRGGPGYGGDPYRRGGGDYRDSYGYRDSPRDYGPPMRDARGYGGRGGYGGPPSRGGMDHPPAHYYDRYGPPPDRYDRGPPPPPPSSHGYPPRGGGGGYYGSYGGRGGYGPPPPPHNYPPRRY